MKFRHCIFEIQEFKSLRKFWKSHFTVYVNGDIAQKLSKKFSPLFRNL